jgi:hypothetical protein
MTLYHILWDHWEGKPAPQLVEEDMKNGKMTQYGLFAGGGRGYAVVDVSSELELLQLAAKYREHGVHVLSAEPVISFEQVKKLLGQ